MNWEEIKPRNENNILTETQYNVNLEMRFFLEDDYCCFPRKVQGPDNSVKWQQLLF